MKDNFTKDYERQRKLIPKVEDLLRIFCGKHIVRIRQANYKQDTEEGIDLITADGKTIALRIRDNRWKNSGDIVLRSARASGHSTEVAKLLKGRHSDYYLYCWATEDWEDIDSWVLFCPKTLREVWDGIPKKTIPPTGTTSEMVSIKISDLAITGCLINMSLSSDKDILERLKLREGFVDKKMEDTAAVY